MEIPGGGGRRPSVTALATLALLLVAAPGCVDLDTGPAARDSTPGPDATGDVGVDDADRTDAGDVPDADQADPGDVPLPPDGDGGPEDGSDAGPEIDAGPELDVPIDGDAGCVLNATCSLDTDSPCLEGRCNGVGDCVPVPVPGCCLEDADCDDASPPDACHDMRCVDFACTPVARRGCCVDASGCDDGEACTLDSCPGVGGRCVHCPLDCACPTGDRPLAADFPEAAIGFDGFGVSDEQPSDEVTWRTSEQRFISPPRAAWLGDPACGTYYSGALDEDCQPSGGDPSGGPVRATLRSPIVNLPEIPAGHVLLFWVWADVEPIQTGGSEERDVLEVTLEQTWTNERWPLTSTLAVGKDTGGRWRLLSADLSPWGGESVRLRFTFDTLDGDDNHHEGVYIDDVSVVPRCEGGCCTDDADCADLAVDDACLEPRCVSSSDGAGTVCAALPRDPGSPCQACVGDGECTDANPCTQDTCGADGRCEHVAFCCFEDTVFADDFEDGLSSWFVADDQPGDAVTWRTAVGEAAVGSASAWLGDPGTGTYETGAPVRVGMTSPQLLLPDAGAPEALVGLSFWLRLSTEWDGEIYDNPAGIDRLTLQVVTGGDVVEAWSSDDVGGSTGGLWVPVEVDLGEFAGEPVQLRWTFDSVDDDANDFGGPYLDDLVVGTLCPE